MVTTTVNIHAAKSQLSKLVVKVENGEEVIIARAGKPAVRMVPINAAPGKAREDGIPSWMGGLSHLRGSFPEDIKTPYKKEIEEMFYGDPGKFNDVFEKKS